MKKFLFFIFTTFILNGFGQQNKSDSLVQLISSARSDTALVSLLNELCFETFEGNPEAGLKISQQADSLAKKIKFRRGEARALDLMGDALLRLGNYPKSLEVQLESLRMNEELKDSGAMAGCMISLANLYNAQEQSRTALDYLFKAETLARSVNDKRRIFYSINNIGATYIRLKQMDSALDYLQQAYAIALKINEPVVWTARSLSYVHHQLGNPDLGLSFLKIAERSAIETGNNPLLTEIYIKKARLFKAGGNTDSAIWYAKRSFDLAMAFKLPSSISSSAEYLSSLYMNHPEEALRYHIIRDSAYFLTYNLEKTRLFQNLAFNENDRQLKIEAEKEKVREERKQNLEYAAIALSLVVFIIIFLLLSRSFITNTKMIEFFGVIALLIVFEFLNLLLHPFLERVTHHSPLLMLLALVLIAALLVPVHHRLQKWMTNALVEKNKRIRLAAARKTIEKLEGKLDNL